MREYTDKNFQRISKTDAKRLYNMGLDVYFCPVNLRPGSPYNLGIWENRNLEGQYSTFEALENAFTAFNCTSNETGRYIAYYVKPGNMMIHFSFSDGSNPYVFRGDYKAILKEFARWEKNWDISPDTSTGFYTLTEKAA